MAGRSIKNKRKYRALKRKGMSKQRAARIANSSSGEPWDSPLIGASA